MKDVPLLDELRATRKRLAVQFELDAERYAEMLRGIGQASAGVYVSQPLLPPGASFNNAGVKEAV